MNKFKILAGGLTVTLGLFSAVTAFAQSQSVRLTLESAKSIAQGCEAFARENDLGVVVAILDKGGDLVLLHRMEGPTFLNVDVAQMKARTSAGFSVPSAAFQPVVKERVGIAFIPGIASWQGGLPIIDSDGNHLGGVGVSGASSAEDEACAAAGLEAAGMESGTE